MSRVWDDSKAEGGGLLLMLAIADHCHDDGTGAWPSIETLAKKTRLSDRHVQRLIVELEKSGELVIKKGGGRHRPNVYSIVLKGDILSSERVTSDPERVTSAPTAYTRSVQDPSFESSIAKSAKKRQEGEKEFIEECTKVFGTKTMSNFGGLWRTKFRGDPDKARRALATTISDMKEKPIENLGGYAADIFGRFV